MKKYSKKPVQNKKKIWPYLISLLVIIIIIGVVFLLHHHSKNSPQPTTTVNTGTGTSSKTSNSGSSSSSSVSTSTGTGTSTKQGSTPSQSSSNPTTPLTPPSGTFVSNHEPTLTGQPGPNEESSCNIQPGASCSITFKNGSITKSLSVQTASSSGVVAWNWSIQSLDLTKGQWTITATASQSGHSSVSTTDSRNLEVE